jgi:hypothetical protein
VEWFYDNQQKEKEIFKAYQEWFICLKASEFADNQLSNNEGIMIKHNKLNFIISAAKVFFHYFI